MPKELTNLHSSISKSLKDIQEGFDVYQKAYFKQKSPEFFCFELNGEAGELANFEKKQWKGKDIDKNSFSDEAADVFIALMNYANARGIDLAAAVNEKLGKIEKKRLELESNGYKY